MKFTLTTLLLRTCIRSVRRGLYRLPLRRCPPSFPTSSSVDLLLGRLPIHFFLLPPLLGLFYQLLLARKSNIGNFLFSCFWLSGKNQPLSTRLETKVGVSSQGKSPLTFLTWLDIRLHPEDLTWKCFSAKLRWWEAVSDEHSMLCLKPLGGRKMVQIRLVLCGKEA